MLKVLGLIKNKMLPLAVCLQAQLNSYWICVKVITQKSLNNLVKAQKYRDGQFKKFLTGLQQYFNNKTIFTKKDKNSRYHNAEDFMGKGCQRPSS